MTDDTFTMIESETTVEEIEKILAKKGVRVVVGDSIAIGTPGIVNYPGYQVRRLDPLGKSRVIKALGEMIMTRHHAAGPKPKKRKRLFRP